MKETIPTPVSLKRLALMTLSVFLVLTSQAGGTEEALSIQDKKPEIESRIPDIAERYVGIPYMFGKDFDQSGAVDNSHLLCLIYREAGRQAGVRFKGYMPMRELLENTYRIQRDELKNGDLMVLNDGLAGLIYRVENRDRLHIIYASLKRERVVSFSSDHSVFQAYWLKNLKGFYRLKDGMFAAGR